MSIEPARPQQRGTISGRYRDISGKTLNRRVVMKAAAGITALAATGGFGTPAPTAIAQDGSQWTTRAGEWEPPQTRLAVGSDSAWRSFVTDFPFYAIGASWNKDVGTWPIVEIQLSKDGASWSETFQLVASNDGGGGTDGASDRTFTPLLHSSGAQYVRFRTVDNEGRPGEVAGLRFHYIDATDGPWEKDIQPAVTTMMETEATTGTTAPPEIITRAEWGANEGYRFADYGEVWPPEYQTVEHIIIHHTDTPNTQDVPTAIRSIYYFHAITQGWGDIGYNYLVGHDGRIYQGRYGGQNVVGGHAYQFAFGSSGISAIGDFQNTPVPDNVLAGLVAITAWVGRDLDPYGHSDFHQAPNLPTIASHRDVNATTCPGDYLWNDLPEIRDMVAAALDAGEFETPYPGGIIPGDRVVVTTGDGADLNVHASAGLDASVTGALADGSAAMVVDGPVTLDSGNWYMLEQEATGVSGWAIATWLQVSPIPPPPSGDFPYGLNILASSTVNVHNAPLLSAGVVATMEQGALGFVLAGPQWADEYTWYHIHFENGTEGWCVRTLLEAAPVDENPAGAKFAVGDTVEATERMNIRTRPGLANTIIAQVYSGGRMQITQPAVAVNGYIWYGVFSTNDDGGWAVQTTMRGVSDVTGKFDTGDQARVTEATNLRTSPSTAADVIALMAAGTTGEIVGGPQTASGFTWWEFQTSLGTGWAAQNWLVETQDNPPDGKFAIGDEVRVTEALNMRSGPSTGNSVIALLEPGTTGTVQGGPETANGYTWWRIETAQGTGWVVETWLEETGSSGDLVDQLIAVLRRILSQNTVG